MRMKNFNNKSKPAKLLKPADLNLCWYYMSDKEITVRTIKDALDGEGYDLEIWDAAGVLEVGFSTGSLDIESQDLDMRDEYSNEFIAANHIKSLFYASFRAEEVTVSMEAMKQIIAKLGGFFVADTVDFEPRIG